MAHKGCNTGQQDCNALQYNAAKDIEGTEPKRVLELLGVPHTVVAKEHVVVEKDNAKALAASLGLNPDNACEVLEKAKTMPEEDTLAIVNALSGIKIRDKSGIFIGARMGRPEKAKMRELTAARTCFSPLGRKAGR